MRPLTVFCVHNLLLGYCQSLTENNKFPHSLTGPKRYCGEQSKSLTEAQEEGRVNKPHRKMYSFTQNEYYKLMMHNRVHCMAVL